MALSPAGFNRAPDLWFNQAALSNITRGQLSLQQVSNQLSSGVAVSQYSDDPVKAALISAVDRRLATSDQLKRNFSSAKASLGVMDGALGEATDLSREAHDIASTQLNVGATGTERSSQAIVVNQMIQSLLSLTQRQGESGYLFGGSKTSTTPVQEFLGGYRYTGTDVGTVTDLGQASSVPVTLSGPHALGSTSGRLRGTVDFNPSLTPDTMLKDLSGARGMGVTAGPIELSVNSGTRIKVDLTGSDSVDDVVKRVKAAIQNVESDTGTTILGPNGVGTSGGSLSLDVVGTNTVQFFDLQGSNTAADLGLTSAASPLVFSATQTTGTDTQPRLTMRSQFASLAGLGGTPLGSIRVNNMGRTGIVDLSGANTVEDIKNKIESLNLGIRVQINAAGTGIDVLNEVAGGRGSGMSIEEVAATDGTATRLGIRSFASTTAIADFNDGRGVSIVDGVTDPQTGGAAPQLNIDMQITLGNTAGNALTVDFRPQDMLTVQSVVDRINSEVAGQLTALGLPTTTLVAGISPTSNGITLTQDPSFSGRVNISARNNSPAAEQLGFSNATWDSASGTLRTEDRAKVRVDNLFTHLIDLRDALTSNDTSGIALAGEKLGVTSDRISEERGLVGSFTQRVTSAESFEADRSALDTSLRSDLADVDYASAASRFSQLQTQLQAAMRVTSTSHSLNLLDFLG